MAEALRSSVPVGCLRPLRCHGQAFRIGYAAFGDLSCLAQTMVGRTCIQCQHAFASSRQRYSPVRCGGTDSSGKVKAATVAALAVALLVAVVYRSHAAELTGTA